MAALHNLTFLDKLSILIVAGSSEKLENNLAAYLHRQSTGSTI
jgi:hypothetical protein